MFKYPIRTRYSETAQDGIIHHSSYIVYFEEARIAFLKSTGCDINVLEKQKIYCPVVDLSVKYIIPLLSGEEVEIHVSLANRTRVRFAFSYKIYRGESLTTIASTSHCFINAAFKPIPIPQEITI